MGPNISNPTAGATSESDRTSADACCSVGNHDLDDHTVEHDVQTFSAMGNETRYGILRLLAGTDEEICSCDLAPELDVNQSTTSRALKTLHKAGLVDRRKDGRWRYYTTTERAESILGAIDASRGDH